jgi:hypothetical protein
MPRCEVNLYACWPLRRVVDLYACWPTIGSTRSSTVWNMVEFYCVEYGDYVPFMVFMEGNE